MAVSYLYYYYNVRTKSWESCNETEFNDYQASGVLVKKVPVDVKYKCLNGKCVESTSGTYTTSNCDNKCSTGVVDKYKCLNGKCVKSTDGPYTTSNCDNKCTTEGGDSEEEDKVVIKTPTYSDCGNGPYKKGCKGTSIATVQQCLIDKGYTLKYGADGKFGKYTEEALFSATGKKEFTKDEVTTICQKIESSKDVQTEFGKEEQKTYWQNLKDKKRIYTKGIIYLLKNGVTYVYIIKRRKDGSKVPISTEAELNTKTLDSKTNLIKSFDEFDYEVLYPINPASGTDKGEVGVITAVLDVDDEVGVAIKKDDLGNWSPSEEYESFEISEEEPIMEQTIKTILKLRLFEQNVTRTIGSSSDPNKTYKITKSDVVTIDGAKSQSDKTTDGKTEEEKKNEILTIMTSKKDEIKTIIDELITYSSVNGGLFKDSKIETFNLLKDEISKFDLSDACSDSKQKEIKTNIDQIDNLLSSNKLKDEEKEYFKKIKNVMLTISDECVKIETKYGKSDDKIITKSDNVVVKQDDAILTKIDNKVLDSEDESTVEEEYKAFLEDNGYTFEKPNIDEKERLATRTTVGQQLKNLDADGIYDEYYSVTTPIWKSETEDFEDLDSVIENIESEIPREIKREYCKSAVRRLYQSAFPSTRVVQLKKRSVIEDDNQLNDLKSAIIRCDEEKNFATGSKGLGDELKSLYRCRSNKKGRSFYGIDRYCMKDYKMLKQDNPTMQMESIVKKYISEAITSKKKSLRNESKVESILREIKRLRG